MTKCTLCENSQWPLDGGGGDQALRIGAECWAGNYFLGLSNQPESIAWRIRE